MIEIRECLETDLQQCAGLVRMVYAEPPYNESWNGTKALDYLRTFLRIDPKGCFVAAEQAQILGAIFAYCYPWSIGEVLFVQELFVLKEHRRKGIGARLIRHLSEREGKPLTVALIAREGTPAADFYERIDLSKSTSYIVRSGKIGS
jgi:ribosomal protein S18 acetylase RimI-like enzyme